MPLLSLRSPVLPSDGVATNRPDGGQHCDGTDDDQARIKSRHHPVVARGTQPTPADELLARHEAGQFLSQTGTAGHLPSILAVNSAVSSFRLKPNADFG